MADPALTLADTVLINAVGVICVRRVFDPAQQRLAYEVAREAVNRANWDHPHVGPLVVAFRKIADRNPDPDKSLNAVMPFEMGMLEQCLANVLTWRLGLSLDALRDRDAGVAA